MTKPFDLDSAYARYNPWAAISWEHKIPQMFDTAHRAEAIALIEAYKRYWHEAPHIYKTLKAYDVYNALGVFVANPPETLTDSMKATLSFLQGWLEGYRVKADELAPKTTPTKGDTSDSAFLSMVRHASHAHTPERLSLTYMYDHKTGESKPVLCIIDENSKATLLAGLDFDTEKLTQNNPVLDTVEIVEANDED